MKKPQSMTLRRGADRGHANHGWLDTYHTFSFASYYDPAHMGFSSLRVINEDRVHPGKGFGTHPHSDMEIVTYVISGELAHKDSMGNGSVIHKGDVQRMSAGTGITHSEYNNSSKDPVHFLQIWLLPEKKGLKPSYEQRTFVQADKEGKLCLVASRDGRQGSVTIHTDAALYAGVFQVGQESEVRLAAGRRGYVQMVTGNARICGENLAAGDAAAFASSGEDVVIQIVGGAGQGGSEILVFDLA